MFQKHRFIEAGGVALAEGQTAVRDLVAEAVAGPAAIIAELGEPTEGGVYGLPSAADPTVIVAASLDRNRWDLDRAENKIAFLKNDPTVSQMEAVREGRIVVMSGAAMNTSVGTLYGAEAVAEQLKELDLP